MPPPDRLSQIPRELVALAKRYAADKTIEVRLEIGRYLHDFLDATHARNKKAGKNRIWQSKTVKTLFRQIDQQTGVKIPLTVAYDCLRVHRRCVKTAGDGPEGLHWPELGWTALQTLATVKDNAMRDRLAKKATKGRWPARRLTAEVFRARGYRRPLMEPGPDKRRKPWQPAQDPRVGLRELQRLARRMERAAEAWLKKTKDKRPLLNALAIADLVGLLDSNEKKITGHDVTALKAKLEKALSIVRRGSIELNRVATELDGLLAIADRAKASASFG